MKKTNQSDQALLDSFIRTFNVDEHDVYGDTNRKPYLCASSYGSLKLLYENLPGSYPPLFEQLVLSYRWQFSELPLLDLLANPLLPTDKTIEQDRQDACNFWGVPNPKGYIQFGRGWGGSYDPVCFDLSSREKSGECRIVRLDHEDILIRFRLTEVSVLANSFRELAILNIERHLSGQSERGG